MQLAKRSAELRRRLVSIRDFARWHQRGWEAPAASVVKKYVLKRNHVPGATWVETGTYRGDTTAFLAGLANSVVSLEPDPYLFRRASLRFKDDWRIRLLNDTSENALGEVLQRLNGSVCLWLDGHYSGGSTYRGAVDSPILSELKTIEAQADRLESLVVLIDDFRDFPQGSQDTEAAECSYPTRDWLLDWAQRNNMEWNIEHDIFVARK